MTQRFFKKKNVTQRIEAFFKTLELNFFLKKKNASKYWFFFQKYDSQNCNFFFFFLKFWLKELIFFWSVTQRIEPFENMTHRTELVFFVTQRIELFFFWIWLTELNLFFFEYDSQNWTFFLWIWPKNWTLYFLNMTQGIEPLISWIWRKESNRLIFEYTQRIGPSVQIWRKELDPFSNLTPRNELFIKVWLTELIFWIWLTELNFFFFWIWLTELNSFSDMTQRIELLVLIRLEELNSFLLNRTQQIEPFFLNDSKNWILRTLRTELIANVTQKNWTFFFFERYSKNWTHFFWIWLKDLNFSLQRNMTQRIEPWVGKKKPQKMELFF